MGTQKISEMHGMGKVNMKNTRCGRVKRSRTLSLIYCFFVYLCGLSVAYHAEAESSATHPKKEVITKEAVQSTQQTLRNEKARSQIIGESKAAQANDKKAAELAGSAENKEKLYDVSADIMANFQGKSVEEMENIINQASKDPEGFLKSLTPQQRAKIQEISRQIEASKKNP